jgi:hypothetical protein
MMKTNRRIELAREIIAQLQKDMRELGRAELAANGTRSNLTSAATTQGPLTQERAA